MQDKRNPVVVFAAVAVAAAGFWFLSEWLRDIHFYWSHGWDFELPNPRLSLRLGGRRHDGGVMVGNLARVAVAWPLIILGWAALAVFMFRRSR